mgnify:CR=1 FL=1
MSKTKEDIIENAKSYIIYSQFKAGYLMMKGFKLHDMAENRKYPNKNVFFFTNIPELHDALKELEDNNEEINEVIG